MDFLDFMIGCLLTLLVVLLALVIHESNEHERYVTAFTVECTAKGGVPQFNYRSTDLCLPGATVIPMETKQ